MKRLVAYPLLVLLASLIFYGGAGVNFVSYCCVDCEDEGVEALLEDKCCDIHEHDHSSLFVHFTNDLRSHGCDIERVSFDWNSTSVQLPDLQPLAFDLFFSNIPGTLQAPVLWVNNHVSTLATGPPVIPPDAYLSLLTTLLI